MPTRHGLDGPGRFAASVQTGPGAHPASCTTGTGSFPWIKRPEGVVDHPPPPCAVVKERVDLLIYFLSRPSWHVLGWNLPLPLPSHQRQSCERILHSTPHPRGFWDKHSQCISQHCTLNTSPIPWFDHSNNQDRFNTFDPWKTRLTPPVYNSWPATNAENHKLGGDQVVLWSTAWRTNGHEMCLALP